MSDKYLEDDVIIDDLNGVGGDGKYDEAIGVVVNCMKLNIREKPSKESDVVAVAAALDELKIDYDTSTEGWFAVCTAAGMEGFCMKKFVAIRQ